MEKSDRYSRQTIFPGIGPEGQRRLQAGYAVVVGCGALGTVISAALVRAGVGRVRVIDRDLIEIHNLPRQLLFTEQDVADGLPKALAAERHLHEADSHVRVEGVVADFRPSNAEELVTGADVIVDGLDNFETRFLVNDVALKLGIPWIYGGAVASTGMTATFLPGGRPCFRCLLQSAPVGAGLTCDTAGVVNAAPWVVGSLQAAEALKVIIADPDSAPVSRDLVLFDLWGRSFEALPLAGLADPDCPACHGRYESLEGPPRVRVTSLCGQDSVQIWDADAGGVSLTELADRLRPLGPVEQSAHMLRFAVGEQELVVFYDGRTLVRGTRDESLARALYARYIGT